MFTRLAEAVESSAKAGGGACLQTSLDHIERLAVRGTRTISAARRRLTTTHGQHLPDAHPCECWSCRRGELRQHLHNAVPCAAAMSSVFHPYSRPHRNLLHQVLT